MATKYYDYFRGDDSNDGNSPETAWKNITKIDDAVYTAGDQHLLASDSVWEYGLSSRIIPPNTWTGTQKNPVVIGKYTPFGVSAQKKPTIRWNHKILANEWTYSAPDNCWTYTAPHEIGRYALVRINNTWNSSQVDSPGTPLASVEGRYDATGGSSVFKMYSPGGGAVGTDPTSYYGEVLLSTNKGFFAISSGRGGVLIQDLHFEDTGTGISGYSDTASNVFFTATRISGQRVAGLITVVTVGTLGQLYAEISYCDIKDYGPNAIWAYSQNGEGFKKLEIHHNQISDGNNSFAQGAIYIQVRSTGLRSLIYQNVISKAKWGSLGFTLDGCGIYVETVSNNVDVYKNIIYDCYMAMQDNCGRSSRWFSNFIFNCRSAMRCGDGVGLGTQDHDFFNNTCIVGSNIGTKFGTAISEQGWRCFNSSTITSLKVHNNVFKHLQENGTKAAILTPTVTPSTSDYSNNLIIGFPEIAQREFSPFTVESSPNTITSSESINEFYQPVSGSAIVATGEFLGVFSDNKSQIFQNLPTIGAFEYVRPRTAATTRTMRS